MLHRASSTTARFCVIVGEGELARGVVAVKDLAAHAQEDLPRDAVVRILADRLAGGGTR